MIHTFNFCPSDANVFYHLETWIGSTVDPYTTVYLSQMRIFQKQITRSVGDATLR